MSRHSVEDEVAGAAAGLAALITLIVMAVIVTFLVAMATEIVRIYRTHAFQPTKTARILWVAAACLLGVWLVAGLLATHPQFAPLAAYLASWGFLAYCVVVEVCDGVAGAREAPALQANAAGLLEQAPGGFPWDGRGNANLEDLIGEGVVLGEALR